MHVVLTCTLLREGFRFHKTLAERIRRFPKVVKNKTDIDVDFTYHDIKKVIKIASKLKD